MDLQIVQKQDIGMKVSKRPPYYQKKSFQEIRELRLVGPAETRNTRIFDVAYPVYFYLPNIKGMSMHSVQYIRFIAVHAVSIEVYFQWEINIHTHIKFWYMYLLCAHTVIILNMFGQIGNAVLINEIVDTLLFKLQQNRIA